jgi:RNA-directed DNA polymerase
LSSPWRLRVIQDPKLRLIAAPAVRDRVVHHALLTDIGPVYERSFMHHSYAAGTGRGPHRAVFQYLTWLRRFRYRLHLDISGYFLNIDHARLRGDLFRRLEDTRTRWLIDIILRNSGTVYQQSLARRVLGVSSPNAGKGLPLGSWFSQWCGAYYLNPMDHYLKRVVKVPGYLRYMDDCVLFCDDKGHLEDCRTLLAAWLADNRGLTLNPNKLDVTPHHSPGVFLGYRISRSGISPSHKLRRRMKARLRLAAGKGDEALIRSIRAYGGLLCFPHG